ncbi:hypothetical protein HON71_00645 [Candidatus Woesearchaeota archaeon]|jgi:transposase-like protein|nr:hypothetical protein [Candidatus Woesearchaeota archaeon]
MDEKHRLLKMKLGAKIGIKRENIASKKMIFCICPSCNISRKKIEGKFTIVRKGRERNGAARFFCLNCNTWFNEKTGEIMGWMKRY